MGKVFSTLMNCCFGREKVLLPSSALRTCREEADIIETTPTTISTCSSLDECELKNSLKYYLVYRNTFLT